MMRRRIIGLALASIAVLLAACSTLLVDTYNYGRIDVFATLDSGEPAEGIKLILYRDEEHLAYGTTNSRGEYTFSFVPFGSVGVYAQLAPTHMTADSIGSDYVDRIDVSDGGAATVIFTNWRRIPEIPLPDDDG